jgi:hypothetical protein
MLRELIERFRYRFYLWRRERREDLHGSTDGPQMEIYDKSESIPRMALRYVGCFLVVLTLLTVIGSLVEHYFPAAHSAARIIVITLACLAAISLIMNFAWEWKAKRKDSAGASASSNQSL